MDARHERFTALTCRWVVIVAGEKHLSVGLLVSFGISISHNVHSASIIDAAHSVSCRRVLHYVLFLATARNSTHSCNSHDHVNLNRSKSCITVSVKYCLGKNCREIVHSLNWVKNHRFFPLVYLSSNVFFTSFFASSLCDTSLNVSFVTTPFNPSSSKVYRVGIRWL